MRAGILAGWIGWIATASCPGAEKAPERSLTEDRQDVVRELMLQIARLEESLALASTEAEYFHKKWLDLRLKVEAMGLEVLTGTEQDLEEKAVQLLGDYFRSENQRQALIKAVENYLAAQKKLAEASPLQRPTFMAEIEAARREVVRQIEGGQEILPVAPDLNSGQVTIFDEDKDVAILNIGEMHGARVGTPFRLLDGETVIGRARLIEVREYLSAALIEDLVENKQVRPGNRVVLDIEK